MVQARIGSGKTIGMMVRVPEDLRDRIKAAADASGRSMNSEIAATLEEKYPAPVEPGLEQVLEDMLEMLWKMPPAVRKSYLDDVQGRKDAGSKMVADMLATLTPYVERLSDYSEKKADALRKTPRGKGEIYERLVEARKSRPDDLDSQ